MSLLQTLFPYLHWGAIVLFGFAVVAFGLSILYFRRTRTAPYYIMRETARKNGLFWFLGALGSILIGALLLFLQARMPATTPPSPLSPTPTATASAQPGTLTPVATPIPSSTPVPSPTMTRGPTATPPLVPTSAPTIPLPEGAVSRLPNAVPADPASRIAFVTFATGTENGRPVDPGVEFEPGDYRVYFFFDYQGMTRGSTWTYAWFQNGEYLDGNTCPWAVRQEDCPLVSGATGSTFLFYRLPGGYEPGIYEVRVWIEDRIQSAAQFIISAEP